MRSPRLKDRRVAEPVLSLVAVFRPKRLLRQPGGFDPLACQQSRSRCLSHTIEPDLEAFAVPNIEILPIVPRCVDL